MPVSLFSALARLDIEPWGEAKRLADMPKDGAIQALRASIDRLTGLPAAQIDAAGIAQRLILLLPKHGGRVRPVDVDADAGTVLRHRSQPTILSGLLAKVPNLPTSVWLVVGALAMIAVYVMLSGGATPADWSPMQYDNQIREPRR